MSSRITRLTLSLTLLLQIMYFVPFEVVQKEYWMAHADDGDRLSGTKLLTTQGDLAALMVAGSDKFLMREIEASCSRRPAHWNRDFSSHESYLKSIEPNRQRFSKYIGVMDPRVPAQMHLVGTPSQPALVGEGRGYKISAVRWNVLKGVDAEGLLLEPDKEPVADVVAVPDCDWLPEMLVGLVAGVPKEAQFARRLAENGCRVLVPLLIDRSAVYSGNPLYRMTNQPHREYIYRAAFEMGRHIIGYEVQKVLSGVDWFAQTRPSGIQRPVGVIGYGEGGLIAFYATALDTRIDAAAVCGYFQPREHVWQEPIYRNVWALLDELGDAEIASLIAPRALVVEACRTPEITGPPAPTKDQLPYAAPGILSTPSLSSVETEFERAQQLVRGLKPAAPFKLVKGNSGKGSPGSDKALLAFLQSVGVKQQLAASGDLPRNRIASFVPEPRLKEQFDQLLEHTQYIHRESPFYRGEFWSKADPTHGEPSNRRSEFWTKPGGATVEKWQESSRWYRDYLWDEVIGRFPAATVPANPRSRVIYDEPNLRGYEVVLDVYPDVFAYGILLLPKDMKPGERRPVVVCQHGLEGRPQNVCDPKVDDSTYHQFAYRLAKRGFVVFAPQNLYIGGDHFRVLQRKANPLKKSLFSIIVRQHERILEWLAQQPFVDPKRMAFYGLSYGGKTAMRVPALLEQYCLSICSGDFNEWIWKNVSSRYRSSYLLLFEYEMPEFNLGNTFNYAEMSWLIFPRPFMVERGHLDGYEMDEWVAFEYAKTRRLYDLLGLRDRAEMEVFNGDHTIHGVGTFEFLHKHLKWPNPKD